MEQQKDQPENFMLEASDSLGELDLYLGTNLKTGSPMVGDKIKAEDGRLFVVTGRTWLSGRERKADMLIQIAEIPAPRQKSPAPAIPE